MNPERVSQLYAELDFVTLLILENIARGEQHKATALRVYSSQEDLKRRLVAVQDLFGLPHSKFATGLFYVKHLLPIDVSGARMSDGGVYTQAGQKLAEWTAWAEDIRSSIRAISGEHSLRPYHVRLLGNISSERCARMNREELPAYLSLTDATLKCYLREISAMFRAVGQYGDRTLLMTVAALAPFDAE